MENTTNKKSENQKPRVALYCRVATDSDGGQSLEMQKERLRVYAEQQDYTVVATIAEVAKGHSLNRPGIRELSGLAHRHAIDEVLAMDLSRISRTTGNVLRLEGKLKKQHVRLNTPTGNPLANYRRLAKVFKKS